MTGKKRRNDKNEKNGHDKKEETGELPPFQNIVVLS